jgi:uncharacterized membrane protein YeaQ/YmgE (transglycosylase-associated protein family)
MHLSNQSLLVIILVGVIAGWLAGRVMAGGGFGLIGDLLVGLIGAFVGDWLLPRLGIHLGTGVVAAIVNAFIGAVGCVWYCHRRPNTCSADDGPWPTDAI